MNFALFRLLQHKSATRAWLAHPHPCSHHTCPPAHSNKSVYKEEEMKAVGLVWHNSCFYCEFLTWLCPGVSRVCYVVQPSLARCDDLILPPSRALSYTGCEPGCKIKLTLKNFKGFEDKVSLVTCYMCTALSREQ